MTRWGVSQFGRRALPLALCAALSLSLAASAQTAPRKILRDNVPAAVARLTPIGKVPANNQLSLAIGLPLRDEAALDEFLRELYDPASANYHKFITPAEFAARFGPTEEDYQAVKAFAVSNGLVVAGDYPNRLVLDLEGNVSNIEHAFQITLRTYRHPTEARDFFAPDTEPSVPVNLRVTGVEGLSDFHLPQPLARKMSAATFRPSSFNGTGPSHEYMGYDFRNAYVPGSALNGAGQTVAVLEYSGYYKVDITNYENLVGASIGVTNYVPLTNVVLSGGTPGTANNDEAALDIEVAIAMAPKLSRVIVYEKRSVSSSLLNRIATDNLAKQVSSSWSVGPWSSSTATTYDNILKNMAAQGQSYFQSSGDSDAYTGTQPLDSGVTIPMDSPYGTIVGGTTLTMNGYGASWSSETVWNYNLNGIPNEGSGGGISPYYAIPSWQTNVSMANNNGSASNRNIPDVALTADNIFVSYDNGDASGTYYFMGTSCAAPLWAGFCALVNQQSLTNNGTAVGFLNPALYAIANSANYNACFHDIITGNNIGANTAGLFYAVAGYDLATGLGTPAGTNLINALAPPPAPPYFNSQPVSLTVTNGANATFSASAGGKAPLSYRWRFNGTNLTSGGNTSGATTNTLTITTVTTNNAGNYTLVVTNNYGSATSSVAVLTVGVLPSFSAQPTNLVVFSGGNAVFSATIGGSTPLACQWRENGTNLVNGSGVSGVTSNVLTLTAVTTNSSGSYSLAVTNGFGAATSSVATLTVILPTPGVALLSSENPSGFKDSVAFTAALAPTNSTGTIQFRTNGVPFDVESLANGIAVSAALALLPRGTNGIAAIYSGDANNAPATNALAQIVTNHPPSAADAVYSRLAGYPLDIAVTNLAANWSDADGDTVSLAAIGVSTNGVTVTNSAGTLVYFDTNNVDDQFVCTITDGWGGTNFQTVHIEIILTNTTPAIVGVANGSNGSVTLKLAGAPEDTYVLETTTNLVSPPGWQPLATNIMGTNGVWQFTDTQATNFPHRFYRLMLSQ